MTSKAPSEDFLKTLVKIIPTSLPKGTNVRKKDGADLVVHLSGEDVVVELSGVLVFGDGV